MSKARQRQSLNNTRVAVLTNVKLRVDINYLNSPALSLKLSPSPYRTAALPVVRAEGSFQAWASGDCWWMLCSLGTRQNPHFQVISLGKRAKKALIPLVHFKKIYSFCQRSVKIL